MSTPLATTPKEARALYDALLSRDARFDGQFFIGVSSTGIYCRPICPAPKPKFRHCSFYRTAPEAESHGFRPCLRCRPETAPQSAAWAGTTATVRRALQLIAEGFLDEGSVEELGDRLGVGSRHLRRLFEEQLGVSPRTLATTQRLHLAMRLLKQSELSITDVAIASGFRSLRRFNDAFKTRYGRPPSTVRRESKQGRDPENGPPIRLTLSYVPPYDWEQVAEFLARRAIPGVEHGSLARYERTFELDGAHGLLRVEPSKGKSALDVQIEVSEIVPLLPLVERLRAVFDLDADPHAIAGVLSHDARFGARGEELLRLRAPGAWSFYETGVRAILGQQITVSAARTIAGRLVAKYGRPSAVRRNGDDACRWVFPEPDALVRARLESIGIPSSRAKTLRTFSQEVHEGTLAPDSSRETDETMKRLLAIPGIGRWTADYIRMRALKDPDAFPRGDVALVKAAKRLGIARDAAELERESERWRPWRAYSVIRLWQCAAPAKAAATRKDV